MICFREAWKHHALVNGYLWGFLSFLENICIQRHVLRHVQLFHILRTQFIMCLN